MLCPTLRLSSLFAAEKNREGATSATSAASPTVHSRHVFRKENQNRGHLPEKYKKSCQMCLIVVKIREYITPGIDLLSIHL